MTLGFIGVAGSTSKFATRVELSTKGTEGLTSQVPKLLESPRTQLIKAVEHPGLSKLVKFHYRENATVGSGSTADMLQHELKTGELYSPYGHIQKH